MRAPAALIALAASALLGGCDRLPVIDLPFLKREDQAGDAGAGGGSGSLASLAPAAEPGEARTAWRPAEERALSVTGNLTVSLPEGRSGPLVLAFANGLTYRLQEIGIQLGADAAGSGLGSFSDVLAAPRDAGIFVYRTGEERVDSIAPAGGLCGSEKAGHVAIAEYVGADGEWAFAIAPFRGDAAPGLTGGDQVPQSCGRFVYRLR